MTQKQHIHKKFCPQGHNTFILGRDTGSANECSECRRIRQKKKNKARNEYKRLWREKKKEKSLIYKMKLQTQKRILRNKRSLNANRV